jgi:hypothetical protein
VRLERKLFLKILISGGRLNKDIEHGVKKGTGEIW